MLLRYSRRTLLPEAPMSTPHVHVVLADCDLPPSILTALDRVGASASFASLPSELDHLGSTAADVVVVVVPPRDPAVYAERLSVLFTRMSSSPRATLVVQPDVPLAARPAHPIGYPVSYTHRASADEISGQLRALINLRGVVDRAAPASAAAASPPAESLRAREHVRQMAGMLSMASRVQRQLLPESLPRLGDVSFSVLFRPADCVSGDTFDVQRLDEEHVGVSLADATGHGIPAALLSIFVRRALRTTDCENGTSRVLEPDEVLERLNRELVASSLADCSFVAVAYALLNLKTREIRLARGGAPYPILRRADASRTLLRPAGSLVGVAPDARFEVATVRLEPGDALLLYSDGVDRVVLDAALQARRRSLVTAAARAGGAGVWDESESESTEEMMTPPGGGCASADDSVFAAIGDDDLNDAGAPVSPDEDVRTSAWYEQLRDGVDKAFERLSQRHDLLRRMGRSLDDLTALAIQIDPKCPRD